MRQLISGFYLRKQSYDHIPSYHMKGCLQRSSPGLLVTYIRKTLNLKGLPGYKESFQKFGGGGTHGARWCGNRIGLPLSKQQWVGQDFPMATQGFG